MIEIGDEVGWQWGSGIATGIVQDIQPTRIEIISKGKRIVRNGTPDDPAVVIKHASGTLVLKRMHEVQSLAKEQ